MFASPKLHFVGRRSAVLLAVAAIGVAAAACYDQPVEPLEESNDRLFITNDSEALSARVEYMEETVPVDPLPGTGAAAAAGEAPIGPAAMPGGGLLDLTLFARVLPPVIDGERIQATSISARNLFSILVSYNMRGAQRLGSVDRIVSLGRFPVLSSSVTFADADVNAVALDGGSVYAAQATDATGFDSPAAVERLRLTFLGVRLEDNTRTPLSSFAATSALVVDDVLYVTTGDGGHLFALDPDDLSVLAQHPLDDARWVAHDEASDRLVVVQGTPGRLAVFEEGVTDGALTHLHTFPFPGADVPESKSTVDVAGGKAFVAAGPDGVQVVCLDDGSVIGSVPRPDPAEVGLPPEVVVTNAVSVDGPLMFISNGEAGVYVAATVGSFDGSGCGPQDITVLGHLRFGDGESVNHVDFDDGILVVASGLGGTKIVGVEGDEDDD